jgi:hypothetical protein
MLSLCVAATFLRTKSTAKIAVSLSNLNNRLLRQATRTKQKQQVLGNYRNWLNRLIASSKTNLRTFESYTWEVCPLMIKKEVGHTRVFENAAFGAAKVTKRSNSFQLIVWNFYGKAGSSLVFYYKNIRSGKLGKWENCAKISNRFASFVHLPHSPI